jgi:hypothetical protein
MAGLCYAIRGAKQKEYFVHKKNRMRVLMDQKKQKEQDNAENTIRDLAYLCGWVRQNPGKTELIAPEVHGLARRCMEDATPGLKTFRQGSPPAQFP